MSKGALTEKERRLLTLLCNTFVPSLESNDQSEFYARKASDIGVDTELTRIVGEELQPDFRKQIQQMLGYFENPLFNLLLNRKLKRFSQLKPQEREDYLTGWANSRIPLRRTGFQALKRLILFINYSLPDSTGHNPNREAIGYNGPPILNTKEHYALPSSKRIKPLQPNAETTLECDACIIGSGAGGSVIASQLSKAGLRVIVLEQGGYNTPEAFTQQEYDMMRRLYQDSGTLSTKDLSFTFLAGVGAGGGTVVNWMTSLRPPDWCLQEWEQDFGITGLTSPRFKQSLEEIEATLLVNAQESQRNPNNETLWQGCQNLDYAENTDYSVVPRNAQNCKERCGPCGYGCLYNGKQSALLNYLPDAYQAGAQFLFNTRAERIEISNGQAKSVEATCNGNNRSYPVHIKSRIIVVACGAINTSALLFRSDIRENVGQGLLLDPTTATASIYPKPINMWDGPMQTVNVTRHLNQDGQHHGFYIEAAPGHPGLIALALPWLCGRQHKEMMVRTSHSAAHIILLREKGSGTIRIDKHGNPVCEYRLDGLDKKHLIKGIIESARINLAAGAQEIWTLHTRQCSIRADKIGSPDALLEDLQNQVQKEGTAPNRLALFSAHLMGGCAMGKDPSKAVVDPTAQVYGVEGLYVGDASIFPTTPGVNPMITIMAMAQRTAMNILEKEKKLVATSPRSD